MYYSKQNRWLEITNFWSFQDFYVIIPKDLNTKKDTL